MGVTKKQLENFEKSKIITDFVSECQAVGCWDVDTISEAIDEVPEDLTKEELEDFKVEAEKITKAIKNLNKKYFERLVWA